MPLPSTKTHLIFDFDETIGTLQIDWRDWHKEVWKIFISFDSAFTPKPPGTKVHFHQNDFFRAYGAACKEKVDAFTETYEFTRSTGIIPIAQTISCIKNSDGKKLYVWSSNSRKVIDKYLNELGIGDRFEKIVSRDMVPFLKPDPSGFAHIDDGAPKSEYLFIGDSDADRNAAHGAGIDFIHISDL